MHEPINTFLKLDALFTACTPGAWLALSLQCGRSPNIVAIVM